MPELMAGLQAALRPLTGCARSQPATRGDGRFDPIDREQEGPFDDSSQRHRHPRIPGPAALPVVGNLFEVLGASQETSIEFAEDYHAKYGGMFALDVLGTRQIFASEHALVAEMCSSPLWSKKVHDAIDQVRDFGGDGLFTAYNEEPNWGRRTGC